MLTILTAEASTFTTNNITPLEEESFIHDIPFNTGLIVAEYNQIEAMNTEFLMEDETYIDDIPFNTACISADCRYKKALQVAFNMPDEETIEDLPAHLI